MLHVPHAFLCRTTQNNNVKSPNFRFWRRLREHITMAVFTQEDKQSSGRNLVPRAFFPRKSAEKSPGNEVGLDAQIVWCANGTNEFLDENIVWYLSVWRDDFSKTICPSRLTSRLQYDIIHIRRSNGWFSRREEMGLATEQGFYGKFQQKNPK